MNLDPQSLPEALQDNPPRPAPNHPAWAREEGAAIKRAELWRRLRIAGIGAVLVCLLILAAGLAVK